MGEICVSGTAVTLGYLRAPDKTAAAFVQNPLNTRYPEIIYRTGDLASYDYDSILRDKQRNINSLFELSDYYVDADPIYRGIIKGVYVPFSIADDWR